MPSPDPSWKQHFTKPTPAQTRALASIEALVADPARWLPTSAWADRQIRAFVPARYLVAFDRGYPDLSKLPPPAAKALAQYKPLKRHACQILTTGQARALLQAFVKAGISPSENMARLSPSTSPACTSLTPHGSTCTLPFQTLAADPLSRAIRGTETRTRSAGSRRPSGLHRRKERFRDRGEQIVRLERPAGQSALTRRLFLAGGVATLRSVLPTVLPN